MMREEQGVPPRKKRHYSYDESVDEPAKLIEDEPTDIQSGVPADGNQSVEQPEKDEHSVPPAFEE